MKSAEGGDYIVNLHGDCVPPKPKGPFEVKGSFSLPFKNVFSEEKKFTFTVAYCRDMYAIPFPDDFSEHVKGKL